ncbi:phage conserved hypothetical protein, phiE125 gp8 family [Cohaesibacter sp. ES.047]|uniref:head-tail connector protein n=1 Tax=Cohaesibacter sp. ES.047 TaxID=1798205 RepID=UPI000BB8BDF8|nr:phage head-tail connector protein [Cohaesibacter sp. ES.047]SNY92798.1 phage conserved hypothetical protein, phiE125 gp8 family [Cohaesibacter sp. ES.047]
MSLSLLSPPLVEPVSLAETKAFMKIEQDHDDDLLRAFVSAARVHLEHLTGQRFITQSWRLLLEGPLPDRIILPVQPVSSILEAAILNDTGDLIGLGSQSFAIYQRDCPATLSNLNGLLLTTGQRLQLDLEVGFGPTAEDVPSPLRHAMKLVVAEWYERRLIADPSRLPSLAAALQPLIGPYKSVRL